MLPGGILIIMHFGTNTGYAIAPLERTFFLMAKELVGDENKIHFSYQNLNLGMSESLPFTFKNVVTLQTRNPCREQLNWISDYIRERNIKMVFGFDLPVVSPIYRVLRAAGARTIISYYGAPLSDISKNILKRLMKKVEVLIRINKPNHFVLESKAMQKTATLGRGISERNTSVVHLGIDTSRFKPNEALKDYAYHTFSVPRDRKLVFYAGHMERRKGVHVLVNAVAHLVNDQRRHDLHLLVLGNRTGEENEFFPLFSHTPAAKHITFGGYRNDLDKLMASCYLGVIASNGWDSFPRSAIEMQASGLPLLVSKFQGLVETIVHNETGRLFRTGDHIHLAETINYFLENEDIQMQYSKAARNRAVAEFAQEIQLANLVSVVKRVASISVQ